MTAPSPTPAAPTPAAPTPGALDANSLVLRTVAGDPALVDRIQALIDAAWPAAVLEAHAAGAYLGQDWFGIYDRWPQFQFGLLDARNDRLLAGCNAIALHYTGAISALPDEGWDWALVTATEAHDAGQAPTLLCALSITVDPQVQGQGLSAACVRAMRNLGRQAGLARMVAPVRPNAKHRYPLIPIATYAGWRTAAGLPFDPWLRVHVRLGGRIVKPCPRSMSKQGTVAEWERWCGLPLPSSGDYVLPTLLTPLQVDKAGDRGLYIEPNVWVVHESQEDPA